MQKDSRREIIAFIALGLSALLWMSLISHSPKDLHVPRERAVYNACGPVGALVSHWIMVWFGRLAAFALAGLVTAGGLALLFRRRIEQWGWKCVGALLFLLALASFEVAFQGSFASSDTLPGGFYGQFFYNFLLGQISDFGTYVILALVLLVALLVSTDALFSPVLARAGGAVVDAKRWHGVGETMKGWIPGTSGLRGRLSRSRDATKETRNSPRATGKSPPAPSRDAARGANDATGNAGADEEEYEDDDDAELEAEEDDDEAVREKPARPPLKIKVFEPKPVTRRPPRAVSAPTGPYKLPPIDLLAEPKSQGDALDRNMLEQTADKIEETLGHFKIEARVVEVQKGPTITQYEVSLAAGIKVNKIINLADDLAMALKAQSVRIVAPIPGKSTVGIEVPNKLRAAVQIRELLESEEYRTEDYKLPLALGKDVAGNPVIADLGEMPHLLIAGSTGSGKSVCINTIIVDTIMSRTPDEVKLILVDPKMVELAQYENIPHLLAPVVTDMKKAPAVLNWMVDKMEERYELFAMAGVRHIAAFNALGREKLRERLKDKIEEERIEEVPERLPFMVIIIDELADLMMTASKEVEASITRLSQKSRAVGIHVILATQRPSVDVITGLIKANMPSRISFQVASRVDSRTILDRNGAEKLLGKGDMLYLPPGTSALQRVQGTFISDKEIRDVVHYAMKQAEPQFSPELTRFGVEGSADGMEQDELYEKAVRIVLGSQRGSVTLLQRQLQIGYTRASRLMEIMHEQGLVGPFKGSKAREVYYTLEDWEAANAEAARASASSESDDEIADEE